MKELMQKYNLTITQMMLIASIDQLSFAELNDLDYVEDRIQAHIENF